MDVVTPEELTRIWLAAGMPAKRASNLVTEIIVHRSTARNAQWIGGESRIVKVFTPSGQHIGTAHEVVLSDGRVVHSHPKDYTRRDCSRVRS